MIIAILELGDLKGKLKLNARIPEILIPVRLPLTMDWSMEAMVPDDTNKHPILVFEWRKQVSRYKHVYRIKEIK